MVYLEKLEEGKTISERYGQTVITAQRRVQGDYVVARSKNGTTRSELFDDPEAAIEKFNQYKNKEA